MFKDKLFFFGAQEWVDLLRRRRPTPRRCRPRPCGAATSASCSTPPTASSAARVTIIDPQTGQPFPGNIIPASRLSANGTAILNLYPLPTPGFRQGTDNLIQNSENPQDQRKDNIRFDYRLNNSNQFTYRFSRYNWVAIDAFRGTFPFARTDWERPNFTSTASWTSTISNNLINEFTYTYSRDDVFINVFTDPGLHLRSRTGINYPYIFPENKEISDKIPTVSMSRLQRDRRRTVSGLLVGPDSHGLERHHTREGASHVQGRRVRSSTRARTTSTRSTSAPFPAARTTRTAASSSSTGAARRLVAPASASPTWRWALFTNYAELGQRNLHGVARARDRRLHPGLVEAEQPADDRRRLPLRLLAAVVLDDEQHRELRSAVLRPEQRGRHQPVDGTSHGRAPLQRRSCCPATASRAKATTSSWHRIRRCWRSSAASRAASRRRTRTSSSRVWASATR